jgi:prophage regulatory protein
VLHNETTKRALRIKQVVQKVGLSEATVWRLAATREFPRPIKLSRGCTVWLESEIDDFLESRAEARDTGGSL